MRILITGGAGFIGSHMSRLLESSGHIPVVLDTLEFGHKESLPNSIEIINSNCGNSEVLNNLFSQSKFDACIHFAGFLSVSESVKNPAKYFDNNVTSSCILLESLVAHNINKVIFSSTAAVYGIPEAIPINEDHPKKPINPYGLSKITFEELLKYYDRTTNLRSISLRYFNACGASLDGLHGEAHSPETHLIPKTIESALNKAPITIFGDDFATPDGTCVRDYIHVQDLCSAHLKALEELNYGHPTDAFNVGTGTGHSNLEIAKMVQQISGIDFPIIFGPRRAGDPDQLVADTAKIRSHLNWEPKHSDLETIIKSAYLWHSTHSSGY